MKSRAIIGSNHTTKRSVSRCPAAIAVCAGLVALAANAPPVRAQTYEVAKLLASDAAADDLFGRSIAVSGDTAVIGAMWAHDDNGASTGSAYIFVRDANGVWSQQARLLASDGAAGDVFGVTSAIDGDTVVVGAPWDDDNGANSGSAYVFTRDANGVWTQQAKLLASDGAAEDYFGSFLAISGDTIVVGAYGDDDNGVDSGSAYVFVRDANGVWAQQAKLLASDGAAGLGYGDFFGASVAIIGDTAVIGAPTTDDNGVDSGSAYVFVRDANGVWSQQVKLLASDGAAGDVFGIPVAISGDTFVSGAQWTNDNGVDSGSAYVFTRDANGVWTQQVKLLASDGAAGDYFGFSVAISGDTAVVGAYGDDYACPNNPDCNSGSAYVFVRDANGVWTQQAQLLASDGAVYDDFGGSVAIDGDTALVTAILDDDACPADPHCDSGSVYVFEMPQPSSADLNGDGVVDGADLASLLTQWGTNGPADINGDGTVDGADLAALLTNWGPV